MHCEKLDRWVKQNPTPEGFYLRAVIKHSQNHLPEASVDVDEGLKMAPDHRGLLLMRVTLLKAQGDYDGQALLDALRLAMIHAPDSALLAFEAGVTAYHMNKLDSARESFARSFQIVGRAGRLRSYMVSSERSTRELHRKIDELAKKWGKPQLQPPATESNLNEATGVIEVHGKSKWVRRDAHGDVLHIRAEDEADWIISTLPVKFNIGFNFKGPVAFNIRARAASSPS